MSRSPFFSFILLLFFWNCGDSPIKNIKLEDRSFVYLLEDINPSSETFGLDVGPSHFEGKVLLSYFGHFQWGTCATRFGELNAVIKDLKSRDYNVELVGIGKQLHISSLQDWTTDNDAPVCADKSPFPTWDGWDASQRELYILDQNGELIFQQNVTGSLPENLTELIENVFTSL